MQSSDKIVLFPPCPDTEASLATTSTAASTQYVHSTPSTTALPYITLVCLFTLGKGNMRAAWCLHCRIYPVRAFDAMCN